MATLEHRRPSTTVPGVHTPWVSSRRRGTGRHPYRASVERLEALVMPSAYVVSSRADSGLGSLRQAILDSNAAGGTNSITFRINGSGVQAINLSSALPAVTIAVVIDGT